MTNTVMGRFFATGEIVNLILSFMLVELLVLILVRKQTAGMPRISEFMVNAGAGAALLLALREALLESAWQRIALWLIVALACHLGDMKMRWAARRTG